MTVRTDQVQIGLDRVLWVPVYMLYGQRNLSRCGIVLRPAAARTLAVVLLK